MWWAAPGRTALLAPGLLPPTNGHRAFMFVACPGPSSSLKRDQQLRGGCQRARQAPVGAGEIPGVQECTEGWPCGKYSAFLRCVEHWGVSTCRPRARRLVLTETLRLCHPLCPPKSTTGLCPGHLPAVPAPQFQFIALPGAIHAPATPRAL